MIQIDDAGSGSLIGGTCIGVLDTDSNKYYHDFIPIELYQDDSFKNKLYLNYVIDIVKEAFEYLKVNKNDTILVCRGYMFDKLRSWFDANNYKWHNTVIAGSLQYMVEESFNNYAISLGFPSQYIKYTKYPFHFHRILKWVYADYKKRTKLCKTGWQSFNKYSKIPIKQYITNIEESKTYHCLKCGRLLNTKRQVKVIEYSSNKPNIIYIHIKC